MHPHTGTHALQACNHIYNTQRHTHMHTHKHTQCMHMHKLHTTTTKEEKKGRTEESTNKKSGEGTVDPELASLQQPVAMLDSKEMLT